jgi:hypothetical protein
MVYILMMIICRAREGPKWREPTKPVPEEPEPLVPRI